MRFVMYQEYYTGRNNIPTKVLSTCSERGLPKLLERIDTIDAKVFKVEDDICSDPEALIDHISHRLKVNDYLTFQSILGEVRPQNG